MLMSRFLGYFRKVEPMNPVNTKIRFMYDIGVEGQPLHELQVLNLRFDVEANEWIINLRIHK